MGKTFMKKYLSEETTIPKEIPRNIKSTKSTGTLSEKFRVLQAFKMFLVFLGVIYTCGYIFAVSNIPGSAGPEYSVPILLGGVFGLAITWYSISSLSKIINFLFELDKTKSDKE